jgi:DNA-binding transcriptional ArsR family regulator
MWVKGDQAVVAIAKAFTHSVCLRLVDELSLGEATVSDLALRLSVPQPSVSSHLGLLRDCGLVEVEARGRQRAYRLRGSEPARAVETLRALAAQSETLPGLSEEAATAVHQDPRLREARTCYDHLGGVAGVRLLDGLLERGWLEASEGGAYLLSSGGAAALRSAGVDLEATRRTRRAFAIGCLDWTERRPHLGGGLGAALLRALLEQRRFSREPSGRALRAGPGEPLAFLRAVDG